MRGQLATLIVTALALFAQLPTSAAELGARPTVVAILKESPLESVLTSYCTAMRQMVGETDLSRDRVFIHHWQASSDDEFTTARLDSGVVEQIDAALSDSDTELVGRLVDLPLVRTAAALERRTVELDAQATLAAIDRGGRLTAAMSDPRRRLIEAISESGTAEVDRRLIRQALRVMLVGLSLAAQRGEVRISWADVDAQASATAPIVAGQYTVESLALAAFTYQSLTDDELRDYAAALATPAMQRFRAVAARAVETVIARAVYRFGNRMAERLRSVDT